MLGYIILRSCKNLNFFFSFSKFFLIFLNFNNFSFFFQLNQNGYAAMYCISPDIRPSFFPSQNNPKNLDPSYKMDLDLWDCLGRVKLVL